MTKKYGPWYVLKSVQKYKNDWLEVIEDQVTRPDKKRGIFGRVIMKPGVSILPIDQYGFVYLTREFHYALGRKSIETVSGGIEKREKPLAAAERELKEELGITAKKWIFLGKVDPFTTVVKSAAFLFIAKNLKFSNLIKQDGTEQVECMKVKLSKALKMVINSEITHGPSCVLILKAYYFLKKEKFF